MSYLSKSPLKKSKQKAVAPVADTTSTGSESLYNRARMGSAGVRVQPRSMMGRRSGTK